MRKRFQKIVLLAVPFLLILALILVIRAQAFPDADVATDSGGSEASILTYGSSVHMPRPDGINKVMNNIDTTLPRGFGHDPVENNADYGHSGEFSGSSGTFGDLAPVFPSLFGTIFPGVLLVEGPLSGLFNNPDNPNIDNPNHDNPPRDGLISFADISTDDGPASEAPDTPEDSNAVPEPSTWFLTGCGLAVLLTRKTFLEKTA